MKKQAINIAKLGAFVLIATACLIIGLYYIGSKKNIFHTTIDVSANFNNVGGLMPGNNVRYNGINVGTVTKLYSISDSTIKVEFTVDEKSTKFITKNSIASIGTDGLLGNKLINIAPGTTSAKPLEGGDILQSLNPVEMDKALRTLTLTGDNLKVITDNLTGVSEKFNNNNSLWHLFTDTALAENVKNAVVHFKLTSMNTAVLTGDLSKIVKDIKAGKGTMGALLTDTMISHRLNQTIIKIESITDSVALISGNFKTISENLKNGKGSIGTLLTDTTFVHDLNISMNNIKAGSDNFNQNMEALKHSWPLKKYFRKQNNINK